MTDRSDEIRLSMATMSAVENVVKEYRAFGDPGHISQSSFYGMKLVVDNDTPDETFEQFELRARRRFGEHARELRRQRLERQDRKELP